MTDKEECRPDEYIGSLPPPIPTPLQVSEQPRPAAGAGTAAYENEKCSGTKRKQYFITPAICLVLHTISTGFSLKLGVPCVRRVLSAATHTTRGQTGERCLVLMLEAMKRATVLYRQKQR